MKWTVICEYRHMEQGENANMFEDPPRGLDELLRGRVHRWWQGSGRGEGGKMMRGRREGWEEIK